MEEEFFKTGELNATGTTSRRQLARILRMEGQTYPEASFLGSDYIGQIALNNIRVVITPITTRSPVESRGLTKGIFTVSRLTRTQAFTSNGYTDGLFGLGSFVHLSPRYTGNPLTFNIEEGNYIYHGAQLQVDLASTSKKGPLAVSIRAELGGEE